MPVVGGRFVPEKGVSLAEYLERGQTSAAQHLIRYEWACEVLASSAGVKTVLDAGCGSGYGAHRLARAVPSLAVVGVDIDPESIAFAQQHYEAPNLRFRQGDLVEWDETIGDAAYDCVIAFDTIQDVPHRDLLMNGIVDHLRPNGALLLSTPVRSKTILEPDGHEINYSAPALYDLVRRYFEEVLTPEDRSLPSLDVFEELNRDEVVYLLRMNPIVARAPLKLIAPAGA